MRRHGPSPLPCLYVAVGLYVAAGGLGACAGGFSDSERALGGAVDVNAIRHPEVILVPTTLGVVDTERLDIDGTSVGVACATCHAPDGDVIGAGGPPAAFHTGVRLVHGDLTCTHCHDPQDRASLRLADGSRIPVLDAMTLCGQCHGPQARDFRHGAHGGMNGYWDDRRGARIRTTCVTCHAPHTPAYERVRPVHPPRDRFLPDAAEGAP